MTTDFSASYYGETCQWRVSFVGDSLLSNPQKALKREREVLN